MHFDLKPISSAGVSDALEKAARYRLLNEPSLAESICLDVLEAEPENQRAVVTLLLARTDQFGYGTAMAPARELLPRLKNEYDQRYYAGIIWERSAHAQLRKGVATLLLALVVAAVPLAIALVWKAPHIWINRLDPLYKRRLLPRIGLNRCDRRLLDLHDIPVDAFPFVQQNVVIRKIFIRHGYDLVLSDPRLFIQLGDVTTPPLTLGPGITM